MERKNWFQKIPPAVCLLFLFASLETFAEGKDLIPNAIWEQHQLQQEGQKLVKNGFYEEAISRFREALSPRYIKFEDDKGFAKYSITHVLILQGKYDAALKEYQWFLDQNKKNNKAIVHAREIQALKEYQSTQDPQTILNYIDLLKNEYADSLPPQGYDSGIGVGQIATILRLYDTIGDQDAGIRYIDEIMEYFKQNDIRRKGSYQPGNADQAYLKLREAFEKDKAVHTKGGATKALIQSDYFPW
ncbi:MAG: hypothetical protein EXS63_05465 [Candidatus Omnitrophica bacterium]|nr:hypothetical protein [Candidatus Omnitrophota bacterium]